jgi:hypothetical protein
LRLTAETSERTTESPPAFESGIALAPRPARPPPATSLDGAGANSSTTSEMNASYALTAVENCQDQARGCFTDGGGASCADSLRACLMSVVTSAGSGPPSNPGASAGGGPPSTNPGAGNGGAPATPPGLADGGAGAAHAPDFGDGGPSRPPLPEAAVAALTMPIGGDSGSGALVCVDALRKCLATAAQPATCAESARTCLMDFGLSHAHEAGVGDHDH